MTLDCILRRNAQRQPAKAALIMGEIRLTWSELDDRVNRLVNAFKSAGIEADQHIALLLGNCTEYIEIYFACARSGLVAVPLNYRLTAEDMSKILHQSSPALLIYGSEYQHTAEQVAKTLPDLKTCWQTGRDSGKAIHYEDVLDAASVAMNEPVGNEHDTLAIFYTSGTTGLPKGAMVSHRNLIMNAYNQIIADESKSDDINLVATPIYHMGAVFMSVTYMMLGCTQVILPAFKPGDWLQKVQDEKISVSLLIPTMINAVINDKTLETFNLETLRLIFYGGGPMPPAVLKRSMELLGCGFTQGYGLTETLEATFLLASDHVLDGHGDQIRRLASAGREAVGAEIRIVDDDATDLPMGEIGEILVRSESVISGYWKQAEETAKAIRDGWFYTGDLGYLDADRYLFVVDRKKDMIISGGVNIYTKEIESHLYRHPAILEAAVIGLADDHWGEVVTAIIVRRDGMALDEKTVTDYCAEKLAGFKKPRRVYFLDALPKNPSGKILKRELRESYGQESG